MAAEQDDVRSSEPALLRLASLAPLDDQSTHALASAMRRASHAKARRELMVEGERIQQPTILLSGWAARTRIFADGKRQILSFVLPGDLYGNCHQPAPLASSTIVSLSDVRTCAAPDARRLPGLSQAYAMSNALEEAYLFAHIARLGRMSARDRLVDLLLELRERLVLLDLVEGGQFVVPLTQEQFADALGLTPVHANRMIQLLRSEGELVWKGSEIAMANPRRLAEAIGHVTAHVSEYQRHP